MGDVMNTQRSVSLRAASRENISPFRISPTPITPAFSLPNGKSSGLASVFGYNASRDATPSPSTANLTSNASFVNAPQLISATIPPSNFSSSVGAGGVVEPVPPAYDALSTHRVISSSFA